MKLFSNIRLLVFLLLALVGGARSAEATASNAPPISEGFLLTAFNSTTNFNTTNVFFTNNLVTTFITISNASPYVPLSITYVTNAFSSAVTFVGVQNYVIDTNLDTTNLTYVTNGDTLILSLQNVTTDAVAEISFTWLPRTLNPITNAMEVAISSATNTASTNLIVNQIYEIDANLGITNYLISQAYITNEWVVANDWITYGFTVTNAGPGTATGVLLTNSLPVGVTLHSSGLGYTTVAGTNIVFNVGALASGTSVSWQYILQPTTNGAFALTGLATAPGLYDPALTDNATTNYLRVTNYLSAATVGTNGAPTYNQLYNDYEQTLTVNNTNNVVAAAVRVVFTGLAAGQLINASGTNHGHPFVVCPAAVAASGSVGLRLQFFPNAPALFTNGQIQAYVLPSSVLNYTPYPVLATATNLNITHLARLANGDELLQFTNRGPCTIVYSTNADFSNALIATPVINFEANRITWLDYGPPETATAPTNSTQRYYRVYLNP